MKKIIFISVSLMSYSLFAKNMNSYLTTSFAGVQKSLEGRKGTMVLTSFENGVTKCGPSKMIDSMVSSHLSAMGVKTSLASRALNKDADQAEYSRVAKLSGGSFILKGSYSVIGNKFSLQCTVMDHNGNGIGACDAVAAIELNPDEVKALGCPEERGVEKESTTAVTNDQNSSALDNYICSVIRPNYDFKKLVAELHKRDFISLDEMSETKIVSHKDLTGSPMWRCAELGDFTICSENLHRDNLLEIYSDSTAYGDYKISKWLHYEKEKVSGSEKCLKLKNGVWNK